MFCEKCGTKAEAGDRFCQSCGASLDQAPKKAAGLPPKQVTGQAMESTYTLIKNIPGMVQMVGMILVILSMVIPNENFLYSISMFDALVEMELLGVLLLAVVCAFGAASWGIDAGIHMKYYICSILAGISIVVSIVCYAWVLYAYTLQIGVYGWGYKLNIAGVIILWISYILTLKTYKRKEK